MEARGWELDFRERALVDHLVTDVRWHDASPSGSTGHGGG